MVNGLRAYNLDWFSDCQGARCEAEQREHPDGIGGLHQAAEEGPGEEEWPGGEVQEVGAEPQEGSSQDTGESLGNNLKEWKMRKIYIL